MTARIIFSLDCEGKWGVADKLTPTMHEQLTSRRLVDAYQSILSLFREFQVPATFAFVGCFAMTNAQRRRSFPELQDLARRAPAFLGPALADIQDGTRDGWTGDWALDAVRSNEVQHEIALHGVTHVPWTSMPEDFIRDEMQLLSSSEADLKDIVKTFVFPRNAVAQTHLLKEFGIFGYRDKRSYRIPLGHMLDEFNIFVMPDRDTKLSEPVCIPGGFFVNWQSGPRLVIPQAFSLFRADLLLRRAAKMNSIVHFWTHPENIASAPRTLGLLRGLVERAAKMRDAGHAEVITQADYCARRRA